MLLFFSDYTIAVLPGSAAGADVWQAVSVDLSAYAGRSVLSLSITATVPGT